MLPPLWTSETCSCSSWIVASIKRQGYICGLLAALLHINACEKFLNHLNYYKSVVCSVSILAGGGIFFLITLKQSCSETFQTLGWKKKEPKMTKSDNLPPVSGSGKQPAVSFMQSGALRHKVCLGRREGSVLAQPRAQVCPRLGERN